MTFGFTFCQVPFYCRRVPRFRLLPFPPMLLTSFSRLAALTVLCLSASPFPVSAQETPADEKTSSLGKQYQSIVNVECSALRVDYRTPWNAATPTGGTGTAFL